MLKLIFILLGRTALILLAAGVVIGIAYSFSLTGSGSTRFGAEGERSFQQGSGTDGTNPNGQNTRPSHRREEGEFRGNGAIARGIVELVTNILITGIFTWLGLLIFPRFRRRLPVNATSKVES